MSVKSVLFYIKQKFNYEPSFSKNHELIKFEKPTLLAFSSGVQAVTFVQNHVLKDKFYKLLKFIIDENSDYYIEVEVNNTETNYEFLLIDLYKNTIISNDCNNTNILSIIKSSNKKSSSAEILELFEESKRFSEKKQKVEESCLNTQKQEDFGLLEKKEKDEDLNEEDKSFEPVKPNIIPSLEYSNKNPPVILNLDIAVEDDNIIKTYTENGKILGYEDHIVVNFFSMVSNHKKGKLLKKGDSYLLKLIEIMRSSSYENNEDIEDIYEKFRKVCNYWYEDIRKFNITDVVMKRPYLADRFVVPELLFWLYGYYIIGKGVNWILPIGDTVKSKSIGNDWSLLDKDDDKIIIDRFNLLLKSENKFNDFIVVDSSDFILLGYINYMLEINPINISSVWKSDNVSFETHIAKSFGSFKGDSYKIQLKDLLNQCNGKYIGGNYRLEYYESFIKRYYKLF